MPLHAAHCDRAIDRPQKLGQPQLVIKILHDHWRDNYALERAIPELLPFAGSGNDDAGLPFALDDYLELVDWSGSAIRPDKRGKIPDDITPILQRLGINPDRLLRYLSRRERGFYLLIGRPDSFQQAVARLGHSFFKGISAANRLFSAQIP